MENEGGDLQSPSIHTPAACLDELTRFIWQVRLMMMVPGGDSLTLG
jgi:hypothetical protein